MLSQLYKKHHYLNKDVPYLISNEIIEYDIRAAGFNIVKKYKLLDDQKIAYLETLSNKQRHVQIGLYGRADKQFAKTLVEKFVDVRQWFFENNQLTNEDVLSIKKDAIVTTKRCHVTQFDNIEFAEKNFYTSYYNLNNFEFYYNKNQVDVKGISDEFLEYHREFMLDFLHNFFKMNEISSKKKVIELLKQFAHYYKSKELNIGYYRELNVQSLYRIHEKLFGQSIGVVETRDKKSIDIGYNYMNYVVPLISILV